MPAAAEKQVFLVTGATNGIGLDTVKYLAAASPEYHVIIGARNLTKGEAVQKDLISQKLPGTLSLIHLDADDDTSITAAATKIEQDFGHLDVLINNAGICPETMTSGWPSRATLRATFETNVFGPTLLTEALIPLLKRSQAPKVINVSSRLGSIGMLADPDVPLIPKVPAYRMSKSALNMLTVIQYDELKAFGCKVWTYCPGYVVTDLGRDRDRRVETGVDSSETSAQGILDIVRGERDAEVGTFVGRWKEKYVW